MFKENVNARTDGWTDGRMHARTTDNGPWHKLAGLRPVELKIVYFHNQWKYEVFGKEVLKGSNPNVS